MRAEGAPTLAFAGPGEFLPDRSLAPAKADPAVMAPLALKAYTQLKYHCVYLSPAAASWFNTHTKALPPSAAAPEAAPLSRSFPVSDKTIGLLLLPPGQGPEGTPTAAQLEAALLAARTLQRKADFIIAVSPWGMHAEGMLLPRLDGFVQLLLGGGPGLGFPAQESTSRPGLLWARSDTKGRALTVIDILRWPAPDTSFQWAANVSYTARELPLGKEIPEDPVMEALLKAVPEDPE